MELKRGDIVWARVLYPKKWWPAVVLSIESIGVAVSFFDGSENPRFFPEREVCLFQENFNSLVQTVENCSKGKELLYKALKSLVRRTISSLKCQCHFQLPQQKDAIVSRKKKDRGKGVLFQSDSVLGFVLGVAVSPFLEVSNSVFAVTAVAQINVFRRFVVSERILIFRQEKARKQRERNWSICLAPPLGSGSPNSAVLEVGFDELSNEDQTNSGSCIRIESQSVHKMLVNLRNLALDANYIRGECLNSVKRNLYMFRRCMYQSTFRGRFKNCSPGTTEAQFLNAQSYGELSDKVGEYDCRNASDPFEHKMSDNLEVLRLNRTRDRPVGSGFSLKMPKYDLPVNLGAYHWKSRHRLDASTSASALSDHSLKFCNAMPFSVLNGDNAHLKVDRISCNANISDASSSPPPVDLFIVDDANSRTKTCLPSVDVMDQFQMQPRSDEVEEISIETNKSSSNNNKLLIASDTSSNPQLAQESLGSISTHDMKQFQMQPSSDDVEEISVETHKSLSNNKKLLIVSDISSNLQLDQESHGTISTHDMNQFQMQPSCDVVEEISVETHKSSSNNKKLLIASDISFNPQLVQESPQVHTNEKLSFDAESRGSSMSIKQFHRTFTSDVPFKPLVGQQFTSKIFPNCQYLHMKFPTDFNLPSKKDLIRKFSRFGQVDLIRTQIFPRLGSAQVVFVHQHDALTAYHFAKRKKRVFGEANVMFWFDPFEKERGGSKIVAPMPNLKSCLKQSELQEEQEHKKCTKKVRFSTEVVEVVTRKLKSYPEESSPHKLERKLSRKIPSSITETQLLKRPLFGKEEDKNTKRVRLAPEIGWRKLKPYVKGSNLHRQEDKKVKRPNVNRIPGAKHKIMPQKD